MANAKRIGDARPTGRIGRPPKVDEHGIPTRERLIQAAIDACVKFGYEGVTLSDIARRAGVSTPAIYSHFPGKAELLVEASQHELNKISTSRIPQTPGLRGLAVLFLQPDFKRTRILLSELHNAAHRQPEVAQLLGEWQTRNSNRMMQDGGLSRAESKLLYLILLGASHVDTITGVGVSQADLEEQMNLLIEGWLTGRYD